MRIPAIGFDRPIGSPTGVTPLAAALAAGRTSVSPEARRTPVQRRRERWRDEQARPSSDQAPAGREDSPAADEAEARPVAHPPLVALRPVLDRPVAPAPAPTVVELDIVLPAARPGALAPDADSALEQHLRRVMEGLPRHD